MTDISARMNSAISHRGPDDCGIWADEDAGLVLAHRRLSILDLSPAGHQPMHSHCGRFVLAFNGEIYNHMSLRRRLAEETAAPAWRGHADTETLLASIVAWGVEKTLRAAVGMFALALWDRHERVLTFARDRMGEKPLYYGWQGAALLFGSEIKALKFHPAFRNEVDRDSIALLLRHNCIPAPYSIFKGVYKLMPGHFLSVPLSKGDSARDCKSQPYWRLNAVAEEGMRTPFTGSAAEASDLLEERLSESIGGQMLADVPLGAFLSGGVDSSTVVALMQQQSSRPVRTFTIGFDESGYDEAAHAKAVARHLGTDHTELHVRPENALEIIPKLSSIYCEPFSDSSQLPTFLLCQLARQHVTVALSGDGGDELFGGYNRYLSARRVWSNMQRLPRCSRQAAVRVLRAVSPLSWDRAYAALQPVLPRRFHLATPGDKAHKLAEVLEQPDGHAFFRQLTSHWKEPSKIVIGAREPQTLLTDPSASPETDSFEHWMMAMDAQTYMPDDILVKVDRAAMANSLETRVPMLDHRVVELAWRMPLDLKIRDGQGKWLLRQVLYRHVPQTLIERPKMGFGIPLDSWLRGPLRDWAEDLLDVDRLRNEGYFSPEPIRAVWNEHLSGQRNWQHHLWDILMFQAWLKEEKSFEFSIDRELS